MKTYQKYILIIFYLISQDVSATYDYVGNCKITMDAFKECLDKELIKYDKELNRLYKKLNSDGNLKNAQKSWIKFKEADCDYVATVVNSGQYYDDISKACLINMTKARINDLNRSSFYFGWFNNNHIDPKNKLNLHKKR